MDASSILSTSVCYKKNPTLSNKHDQNYFLLISIQSIIYIYIYIYLEIHRISVDADTNINVELESTYIRMRLIMFLSKSEQIKLDLHTFDMLYKHIHSQSPTG